MNRLMSYSQKTSYGNKAMIIFTIAHMKYDSDLTTDANFYYRGSKASYKSIFRNFGL